MNKRNAFDRATAEKILIVGTHAFDRAITRPARGKRIAQWKNEQSRRGK